MSAAGQRIEHGARALDRLRGWPAAFIGLAGGALLVFLALPWPLEGKSLAVLHGLCAQIPSHSFYFGSARLPFDARMTGIYSGFATTALYLLARGRWRAGAVPTMGLLLALVAGVAIMGIDGLNSTLRDMGVWHAYEPLNALRLFTGQATGVALGVFIWLLFGQLAFAPSPARKRRVIDGPRDLAALSGVCVALGLVVLSGWGPLRAPLTLLLIGAAVTALTSLALAFVLLVGRRENRARTVRQLAGPATAALLIAYLIMGVSAGGRFLLEATLGASGIGT